MASFTLDSGGSNLNGVVSDTAFPTFDANGNLLGNITSSQGQAPAAIPALPSFDGETLPLGGSATSASPGTQPTTSATAPSATTGTPTTATATPTNPTAGSVANSWFARGAVVILGFVFVAVGLAQFGKTSVTDVVRKVVP